MKILPLLLSAAIVACTGCSTVKRAREAQKPENVQKGERTVTAAELGIVAGGTYSLKQLEEMGIQFAPSVTRAMIAVSSAELALKEAGATERPKVTGSVGHTRATQNTDPHRETTSNTGHWNGALNLNWTLYDFGRTDSAEAVARANLLAALSSLRAAQVAVVMNIRVAFFELKRAIELNAVAVSAEQQYLEHYEQVKERFNVGRSTSYDLLKAEVDWNTATLKRITTSNDVENAWCDMNAALGLAEAPVYKLGDGSMKEYELSLDNLMEAARKGDPSLASLLAKQAAAVKYIDQMIAELYPSLGVNLGGTVTGRNTGMPWLWNLTGGATLSQTILDGGTNLRKIDSAVLALRTARTQVAEREQELFQLMRKAVLLAQKADKQLLFARTAERSALQNLEIVTERFNQGKASSVERTDAQVSHSTAKAAVVTAIYDRQDALAVISKLIAD